MNSEETYKEINILLGEAYDLCAAVDDLHLITGIWSDSDIVINIAGRGIEQLAIIKYLLIEILEGYKSAKIMEALETLIAGVLQGLDEYGSEEAEGI
ncbi:hypothetical protein [Listeria ilorinensis]|uniref:hypothetical protein n=1 Tax=Listeria ilorinensis TaxID=2867439 RepID=UPI001EF71236|nr:hypothetical protein [Listeria ilorinensis]